MKMKKNLKDIAYSIWNGKCCSLWLEWDCSLIEAICIEFEEHEEISLKEITKFCDKIKEETDLRPIDVFILTHKNRIQLFIRVMEG